MRRLVCSVIALVLASCLVPEASAVRDDTILVSRAGGYGPAGDAASDLRTGSISADGRYVVFHSAADNLDAESNDAIQEVFVHDRVANTTTLVSRATGDHGQPGDIGAGPGTISADGRYVAFASDDDNLDAESNDLVTDIFVRDIVTGATTLVSRASGSAGAVGNAAAVVPSISGDGRYVAFHSSATNLHPDANGATHVFIRDLETFTTTLVSRATGASGAAGTGNSFSPSVSGDGRSVAFWSEAGNLDAESNDAAFDVFVRDLDDNTTTLVSRATGASGAVGDATSANASISADGRRVAFRSEAGNLDGESDDAQSDVFVRDLVARTTTLVSRADGVGGVVGNGFSLAPSISGDGRRVAFSSAASNLVSEPTPAVTDIFVRDLDSNTTTLVTRASGATGAAADASSDWPSISADGRVVAFASDADNLDADSNDAVKDVFIRDVLGPVPPPSLSISSAAAKEGRSGQKPITLTVTLSGIPGRTVTVDYLTVDRSATVAGSDYDFARGSLTFAPGETTKQVVVFMNGDRKRERKEYFGVRLFDAAGAEIRVPEGKVTIKDDDNA